MSRFNDFLKHLNNCDANQKGEDPLAVVGMISSFEPQILNKAVKLMPENYDLIEIGSWVAATTICIATSLIDRFGEDTEHRLHTIDPLSVDALDYDGNLVKQVKLNRFERSLAGKD